MNERDRAEKKAKERHGSGAWHPSKAAEKAQRATVKAAKRARRRLDDAIVREEQGEAADEDPKRRKRIGSLLDTLCVELGFCLPQQEQDALLDDPLVDIAAFTERVFRAAGLDPSSDRHLYRQVEERVAKAWPGLG